jgi:hypothetical protein
MIDNDEDDDGDDDGTIIRLRPAVVAVSVLLINKTNIKSYATNSFNGNSIREISKYY